MPATATVPSSPSANHCAPDTALSFRAWTLEAIDCLREHWPNTDPRQLEALARELFADPASGVLPPREAVARWMQYVAPRAAAAREAALVR
jgi:hypothetical protein